MVKANQGGTPQVKQIRVLHVIGGGEFGGAERHILNLARAMDPQRVSLTVCCLFAAPFVQVARRAGINATAIPMRHKLDFGSLQRLRSLLREEQFDLVHTHGVRANLLGRLSACGVPGVRAVITTVHSLMSLDYPGFWSRTANLCTERVSRRLTTHFIAVSEGMRQHLVSEGVPREKISVIYNGLDVENFLSGARPGLFRRQWGIAAGVPVFAIVGRLHSVKGQAYFLRAAALFLRHRADARFLVVGYGPDRPALENLARELGIADKVLFTGFVEDIPSLLADLDLLVIASLSEGFSFMAVEAMAVGVPVLATAVGGLREVVEHGRTGMLVPPRDPDALAQGMQWLLEHPGEARRMVEAGRRAVREKFSATAMAGQTEALYRRLLGAAEDGP